MKRFTDDDVKYCDAYLENGENASKVAEIFGVSNTAVYKHISKPDAVEYIKRKKHFANAKDYMIDPDSIRHSKTDALKSPEGLLGEAINIYNSIPDPKIWELNIQNALVDFVEENIKEDSPRAVNYARLGEEFLKKFRSEIKLQLEMASHKGQAYKNISQYHKDFQETRDKSWEELLLLTNKQLKERAESNFKNIMEMLYEAE